MKFHAKYAINFAEAGISRFTLAKELYRIPCVTVISFHLHQALQIIVIAISLVQILHTGNRDVLAVDTFN